MTRTMDGFGGLDEMNSQLCRVFETFQQNPSTHDSTQVWTHLNQCASCFEAFRSADGPGREALAEFEFAEELQALQELSGPPGGNPTVQERNSPANPKRPTEASLEIPGFELERRLGRGGSSEVWLARQLGTDRNVALKVMQKISLDQKERMERECRILASVSHPYLLPIYASGIQGEQVWLALEYCPGGSLAQQLEQTWDPTLAATIVWKMALAAQAIHEKGIVHRDIKPGNVLIGADGEPRLADFDLARNQEAGQDTTHRTEILGTPAYIAPEQVRSKKVDSRADVHALGGLLYHLLTGNAPFQAKSNYEALLLAVHTDPVPPIHFRSTIPQDLDQICRKCLAKDPRDRYQTAKDLAEDLQHFLEGKPVTARPLNGIQKSLRWAGRNPIGASLILAGVGALVSITVLSILVAHQANKFALETGNLNEILRKKEIEARFQEDLAKKETIRARTNEDQALGEVYRNRLTQAQVEYEQNDFQQAVERLEQCPFHLRGWEHDFLYSKMNANQFQLDSNANQIPYSKLSNDNITYIDNTGTIYKVSTKTGANYFKQRPNKLPKNSNTYCYLLFNDFLAVGLGNGDFFIFGGGTFNDLILKTNFNNQLVSIIFLDSLNLLAIGSADGSIYFYDYIAKKVIKKLETNCGAIRDMSIFPNGKHIAACGSGKFLFTISVDNLSIIKKVSTQGTPSCLSVSPDGRFIVIGNNEDLESLTLRDAETLEFKRSGFGHKDHVRQVRHSPDGMYLVSGGHDRKIIIWDPVNLKPLKTLKGHQNVILTLDIHPAKPLLVSGGQDGRVTLWNLAPHTNPTFFLRESGNRIHSIIEDKNKGLLIAGTTLGEIWFFKINNAKPIKKLNVLQTEEEIKCLTLIDNSNNLALGTGDGNIYIADINNGKIKGRFEIGKSKDITKIAFYNISNCLYIKAFDKYTYTSSVFFVNLNSNKQGILSNTFDFSIEKENLIELKNNGFFINNKKVANNFPNYKISNFQVSDDLLYGLLENGMLFSINLKNGHIFSFDDKILNKVSLTNLPFSSIYNSLVSSDNKNGFKIWDLKTGKMTLRVEDHTDEIKSIFSIKNNQILYTTSNDRSIRLYEPHLRSPRALVPLGDPPLFPTSVNRFTPGLPPRFSFDPTGEIVLVIDSMGFRGFSAKTLRQVKPDTAAFPNSPILENELYSLEWSGNQLFITDKNILKKNQIYYQSYIYYINSPIFLLDYTFLSKYIFNRNPESFFFKHNYKSLKNIFFELLKMKF